MAKRILVIEDEVAIRDLICMNLEVAGYETVVFGDGIAVSEALKKEHNYDCALLDIMLPGKDGFALLPELSGYQIPVIFLTAKGDIQSKIKGLTEGAEDYLVKPFMRAELVARVNSLLRRYMRLGSIAEVKPESVLAYHELELDTEAKRFSVRGSEVKLTPTELKIVTLLMKNPGRIFNAKEIYERVWDSDAYAAENTVMIHISRIRSKIEINPAKPEYIKVVWGIGYKLERE